MDKKVILCIEDNPAVQLMNKPVLESKGFTVKMATTIDEAWNLVKKTMPDLIILDIHLPDGNGLDFLCEFRKSSTIPVIALTNNKKEQDIVDGLAAGFDDYIPKPYSLPILSARIDALLRRIEKMPSIIVKGTLTIKVTSDEAYVNGANLGLSRKEFSLLFVFVQNEDIILSTEYLYEAVWGQQMLDNKGAIKNAIHKLRKKLTNSGYSIFADYGRGYFFGKG